MRGIGGLCVALERGKNIGRYADAPRQIGQERGDEEGSEG
jgi:hypothetical protein